MALFFVAIKRDSVSLLRFPFHSHVHVFLFKMLLVCRLKQPQSCFFLPHFSGYYRSAAPRVVSIISGGYNHSSSALLYVVFESLYRCVLAVFNIDKSSSTLSSSPIYAFKVVSCAWSLVFLFSGPFV